MRRIGFAAASIAAVALFSIAPAYAQSRLALVIANSAYQGAPPIATAAADAGLIATSLQAAGFDVTRSDDLTTQTIGDTIASFIGKVQAAGPDAVVFVYYSGYAAQGNGDDHLVPVDARIDTAASVPQVTLPLSALTKALGGVPSAARIIVLDAARDGGFGKAGGQPVPPGLALTTVPSGFLLAYSAAPDTYAPAVSGTNSPYAAALATLLAQPGLDIEQVFKGVRLQVNQASTGAQLPWTSSALDSDVKLVAALPATAPTAAPAAAPQTLAPALGVSDIAVPPRKRRHITKASMRAMSDDDAYNAAIGEDSLRDYQWFVQTHPEYARAGQVWGIIGNRREGILWRRTLSLGSTRAYWNYLDRYPDGAHADIARSVLANRGEPLPSNYVAQPLDLPSGYYDEAIGLPDLVPDGYDQPANVFFGSPDTEFVPAPQDGSINFNFNFGKRRKRDGNQSGLNPNLPCTGCSTPTNPVVNNNVNPATPANPVVNNIVNPATPANPVVNNNVNPATPANPVVNNNVNPATPANPVVNNIVNPATPASPVVNNNVNPATPINPVPPTPKQKTSTNCVNNMTNAQMSKCLDEIPADGDSPLYKAVKKLSDEQEKKQAAADKKKAAEDAAAEKAAYPDEPVQHFKASNQPNSWQKLVKERTAKCASQTGMTQADRDACKSFLTSNNALTPKPPLQKTGGGSKPERFVCDDGPC